MKKILIFLMFIFLFSAPAYACRGTEEFPQVIDMLGNLPPSEKKTELSKALEKGQAIHEKAHQNDDKDKMRESLKILDGVKEKLK